MVCSAQPWGSLRREARPPGDKAPSEPNTSSGSEAMGRDRMEGQRAGQGARVGGSWSLGIKQKCPSFPRIQERRLGRDWRTRPPVTLTKLLKSPSGIILGSELPGISKVRPRGSGKMRGVSGLSCCPRPLSPPTPRIAVFEWRSLTQGVEFIDHLLPVKGPFSLWRGNGAVRDHTGYSLSLPVHTPQDLQLELQGHSGARIVESAMDQSIGFGGWPQPSCRERARALCLGMNLGAGDLDSGVFHSPRLVES